MSISNNKEIKQLSLSEFKSLMNQKDWLHIQETVPSCDSLTAEGLSFDYETDSYKANKYDDPNNFREGYGWCELISCNGDYQIVQQQQYHYTQYQPDSVYLTEDVEDEPLWIFTGFEVVEGGEALCLYELMADAPKSFKINESSLDKYDLSGKELDISNVDTKSSQPSTIILSTLGVDVSFTGNQLASVITNYHDQATQEPIVVDGAVPHTHLVLNLYQAHNGNYICQRVVHAIKEDIDYVSEIYVATDVEAVETFYGRGQLATELYKNARI